MTLISRNPATGEVIEEHASETAAMAIDKLVRAERGQWDWKRAGFEQRALVIARAADVLREKREELASIATSEMGKLLSEARSEVEKCAWVCEHYAEHAESYLRAEEVQSDGARSLVTYSPLGVLLAIMPWNFPYWQVFRAAAPNLMAGNAIALKHASNVQRCATAIEGIFVEAGLPEPIFQNLAVPSSQMTDVVASEHCHAVTLTGSEAAGRKIAEQAGKALKKTVLELGGSDPYLILEDADLEKAASLAVKSRLINNGQSCIAAKRFIAVRAVYDDFVELVCSRMREVKWGDPTRDEIDLGPQARHDLRDDLHGQVEKSIAAGASLAVGGLKPDHPGAYYPATVLCGVEPGMVAFEEELFGPVAAIIAAEDEAQAIERANASRFGLGAAVFTRDVDRGLRIARDELDAGSCFVNAFVKSDPRLPFGGVKASGYGRELAGLGIREFMNAKTVYVGGD